MDDFALLSRINITEFSNQFYVKRSRFASHFIILILFFAHIMFVIISMHYFYI